MPNHIRVSRSQAAQRQDFAWGNLTWFANQALGNSNEITLGRCLLKPGASNGRHYHPNCSEILVVVRGRIRHTIGNAAETELQEGDTVSIPPNVTHCATNVGETEAILFIAFSSADRQTVAE